MDLRIGARLQLHFPEELENNVEKGKSLTFHNLQMAQSLKSRYQEKQMD